MKTISKKRRELTCIYLILLAAVIWTLFPFYWTFITSLKSSAEIAAKPITYWPVHVITENYSNAWKTGGFSRYFLNSLKGFPYQHRFYRPFCNHGRLCTGTL